MSIFGKLHFAWRLRYWHFSFSTSREKISFDERLHDTWTLYFIIGPFHGWLGLKGSELYAGELKASSQRAFVDRETFDLYEPVRQALKK